MIRPMRNRPYPNRSKDCQLALEVHVRELIDKAIAANDRVALNTACQALDRVLRVGHYWVSAWYKPSHWIAHWDTFSRPATKPRYARGAPETWWYDADKASKIEQPG